MTPSKLITLTKTYRLYSSSLTKKTTPRGLSFTTLSSNQNLLNSFFILSSRINFSLFNQTLFSQVLGLFTGRPDITVIAKEIQLLTQLFKVGLNSSSDKRIFFKSKNLRTPWTKKAGVISEVVRRRKLSFSGSKPSGSYRLLIWHKWSRLWTSSLFLDLPEFRLIGSVKNKNFKPSHYNDYSFPKIYKRWKWKRRKTHPKKSFSSFNQKHFLNNVSKLRLLSKLNRFDSLIRNNFNINSSSSLDSLKSIRVKNKVLRLKPRTKSFRDKAQKRQLKSFFRIPSKFKRHTPDYKNSSFLKLFSSLVKSSSFFKIIRSGDRTNPTSLLSFKYNLRGFFISQPLFKRSQFFEKAPLVNLLSYTQFYSKNSSHSFQQRGYFWPKPGKTFVGFNQHQFQKLFNLWSNNNKTQTAHLIKGKRLQMILRKKYSRRRVLSFEKYIAANKILPLLLKLRLDRYKNYLLSLMKLSQNKLLKLENHRKGILEINFNQSSRVSNLLLFFSDPKFSDLFSTLFNLFFRHSYFYSKSAAFTISSGLISKATNLGSHDALNDLLTTPLYILRKVDKTTKNTVSGYTSFKTLLNTRYNRVVSRSQRFYEKGYFLQGRQSKDTRKRHLSFAIKKKGQTKLSYITRFRILSKNVDKKVNASSTPFPSLLRRLSYPKRSRLPKRRFILKKMTPHMRLRLKQQRGKSETYNPTLIFLKYVTNNFSLKTFKSPIVKTCVYKSHKRPHNSPVAVKKHPFFNSLNVTQLLRIFKNTTNTLSQVKSNSRLLKSTNLQSFRRGPYFLIQFLSILKTLPEVSLMSRKKFFYSDPFNFVDYKRLKKTVFRRLIMQRTKMLKSPFRFTSRGLSHLNPNSRTSYFFNYNNSPFLYKNLHVRSSIFNYKTHYKLFFGRMKPYYDYLKGDQTDTPTFIRKIRFKPGYQRMWRYERNVFKETFKLTHRYQYRLTPKIQLMYYPTRYVITKSSKFQLKLSYALVLSRLSSDQWTSDFLIDNKYVYLNGNLVTNGFTMIFPNDFLQLIISLRFYVLHRWLHMLAFQRFNNWLRRYYKTYRIKKQLFKDFTFRSLPDSVLNLQNSFHDVPKIMEVDYFTLSSFVLYSSKEYNLTHPLPINVFRLYVINMYNWKYLT